MGLCIEDTNVELLNFLELNQQSSLEINSNVNDADFIAIPSKYKDGSYYYAKESVNFIKYCRNNDLNHSW